MKKFLFALLIAITVSVPAFGVTSNDVHETVYLRQDVFEAKMDAFMAEIKLMNEQLRSELKKDIQDTNSRIDVINARLNVIDTRMDNLHNVIYWGLGFMTIIITLVASSPYLIKFVKAISHPPFTLEDVEKLIDTKLQNRTA